MVAPAIKTCSFDTFDQHDHTDRAWWSVVHVSRYSVYCPRRVLMIETFASEAQGSKETMQ